MIKIVCFGLQILNNMGGSSRHGFVVLSYASTRINRHGQRTNLLKIDSCPDRTLRP